MTTSSRNAAVRSMNLSKKDVIDHYNLPLGEDASWADIDGMAERKQAELNKQWKEQNSK